MPEVRTPVDVARKGHAAWNSGDCETFIETVHPEIVWTTAGIFPGLRSSYSGHDGIRSFWAEFVEPWERLEIGIVRFVELDEDRVLILSHFHATGREGIEADREIVQYMALKDEKLHRFRAFADWQQALDELGIEDPPEGETET
jgi:ketosteroid isomerase-like protein